LTGTVPKDAWEFQGILASIGPVINQVSAHDLQEKGVLAQLNINVLQTNDVQVFTSFQDEYSFLVTDDNRLQWIANKIAALSATGNTLVLINRIDTGNKEDFAQVVKRTLGKFKTGSRVLILNDEAHHCYLPKSKSKTTDNEESDENARAAVWFSGLKEIAKKFKLQSVYDLSATPYYLTGSGYPPYSLFPWVVSDFGLIEAIESGLVKIPFLPESDSTQELTMPVLRDLYRKVMDEDPNALPRKGQKKKKSEAHTEGTTIKEQPPQLPSLVKGALDQFYNHYVGYFNGIRKYSEEKVNIFSAPPVFIVVCNNTSVSKEVYKYIA
jgi:type III restriction enzyme